MNRQQKQFINDVLSKIDNEQITSCLLGPPGTGKSYVINEIVSEVNELKKIKVFPCATNGIAAKNVNGKTIHSMFGFPIISHCMFPHSTIKIKDSENHMNIFHISDLHHNPEVVAETQFIPKQCIVFNKNPLENLLVIDEISTCGINMLTSIDKTLRVGFGNKLPFGGVHIIIVGDFFQLDPINDIQIWDSELEYHWDVFELTESMRCDEALFELCNKVRRCEIKDLKQLIVKDKGFEYDELLNTIYLFTHKNECKEFNEKAINFVEYNKRGNVIDKDKYLCVGLKFIFNKKYDNYCNGTIGRISELMNNVVIAEIDGQKITLPRGLFGSINDEKACIVVFFGLTIHKFQGYTLDRVCVKIKQVFEYALLNVMLSRVRTLENITIVSLRDDGMLECLPEAKANYLYKIKMIEQFIAKHSS